MDGTRQDAQPVALRILVGTFLLGAVLLTLVGLPRFARHDPPGPSTTPVFESADRESYGGLVTDQVEYFRLTEYYAGRGPAPDTAPFTSRLLVPWLAGHVPLAAPIAFNLVSLALLLVGLASVLVLERSWGLSARVLLVSAVVYAVSFPVLWYSMANWTDAGSVGLVGLCVLAAYRRWWWGLLLLVPAVLAKETSLVLVAFGVALEATRPVTAPQWARTARMGGWVVLGVASYLVARTLAVASPVVFSPWVVTDLTTVVNNAALNLRNDTGPPAVVLTAALPMVVLGGVWWLRRYRGLEIDRPVLVPLAAGAVGAFVLSAVSFPTALWDGRVLWVAYPFVIPLGAVALDAVWRPTTGTMSDAAITARDAVGRVTVEVRPIGRARLAGLAVAVVAIVVVALAGSATLGRRLVPAAAWVEPTDVRWARDLGDLRLDPVATSGRGHGSVPVPVVRSAPLLLDYDMGGSGHFSLGLRSAGSDPTPLVVGRSAPSTGTVLVDASVPARVEVIADGAWTLRFRSVSDAFQLVGNGPVQGAGDAVLVLPGGWGQRSTAEFRSRDGSGGIRFVHGGTTGPLLADGGPVPLGTEAAVVTSASPWELVLRPEPQAVP